MASDKRFYVKPRGFAAMTPEQRRIIASKGGRSIPAEKRSFSQNRELARTAGKRGGNKSSKNRGETTI